jgi:hypothetical protein
VAQVPRSGPAHFCLSRLFPEEGLEGINDNYARCVICAHRFKHCGDFIQSDTLMNDSAGLETTCCAHREHGIEALSLHAEGSVDSKLIEQNYIDGQRHIAFLFAGGLHQAGLTLD